METSTKNMNEFIQEANQRMMYELAVESGVVKTPQEWNTKCEAFLQTSDTTKPKTCLQWNKECLQYLTSVPVKPILKRQSAYNKSELQKERMSDWDQHLAQRQTEFKQAFQAPIPEAPVFQEGDRDIPIARMEELIAETVAARQYDLDRLLPPSTTKKYIQIDTSEFDATLDTIELPGSEGLFARLKTTTETLDEWKASIEKRLDFLERECVFR